MKDILSNEEIDTLLDMFRSEGAGAEGAEETALPGALLEGESGPDVRPADLLRPNRLGPERMRGLERTFEGAAKALGATISDRLRLDMLCDCVALDQMLFRDWLAQLRGPVAIYAVRMPPFEQPVLLTVNSSLLYGAVDRILGGSGKVKSVPKDFTAAEYSVADAIIRPCLDRICESLKDLVELEHRIESRYSNASLARILPGYEVVLSVHFQVSGEFLLGDLRLAIGYPNLEPYLDSLGLSPGESAPSSAELRDTLAHNVRRVPLEMAIVLGEARLPLRQLLGLRAGDVVPLARRLGEPLVAPVQGVPKFTGQVGTVGSRLAFQIGSVLEA